MLLLRSDDLPDGPDWLGELKFDGYSFPVPMIHRVPEPTLEFAPKRKDRRALQRVH